MFRNREGGVISEKMKTYFSFLVSIIILTISCSPFSKEVMRQVDEIKPFREIKKAPELYLNKTVLWGGVIIETMSKKDEALIKVIQTELDMGKRPHDLDISGGRFLVRYPGFLDPAIYEKGREITVVGKIVGKELIPLGEVQYTYPVILSKEIYLWSKPSPFIPIFPPSWYYCPSRCY